MSEHSFEKINYSLRPAKCVERKMMVEALSRLGMLESLSKYRYVGLGSVDFVDFRLAHYRLGISDMVSIEAAVDKKARFVFNRPLACINIRFGLSGDVLPELDWDKRSIVWMDFDSKLDKPVLNDLSLLVDVLHSGSAFMVTVNCERLRMDPEDDSGKPVHQVRYDAFKEAVGEQRIPGDLEGKDFQGRGLAKASWMVVDAEIRDALAKRNAALLPEDRVEYTQLFHFRYSDGAMMLTVGGILLSAEDRLALDPVASFKDLDFIRASGDEYMIDIPMLTLREMRLLDSSLPDGKLADEFSFLPNAQAKSYARIYRYFPTYLEVESA
jgi:Putative O-methyltransferase